jgi:hypothetical protein
VNKLFIVGCPRSGTTMVQQALNRHSQIVIPPETKFFFAFFGRSRRRQLLHLQRLNADLGIDLAPPPGRVHTGPTGRAFYETLAAAYTRRLGKTDAVYFGDKTPEHTGYLPRIRALFPDAKILVVYRDGRDVAVSLSRMPWMSSDVYVNFAVWLYYQWVVRAARHEFGAQIYFARYEDVVADPARELGGILDFLGLPYEAAVAEGYGNRDGIPEREYAWKARALERITPERVGTFQRVLTPTQLGVLERLGRNILPALGYPLVTAGTGSVPLTVRCRLLFNLGRFALGLPWDAVASELVLRANRICFRPLPPETRRPDAGRLVCASRSMDEPAASRRVMGML